MNSALIRKFINLARKERLTYMDLAHIFKQVRRNLGLSPNGRNKHLPRILTDQELSSFFKVIEDSPLSHKIMLKLLFYTGLRVSELVNIKVSDIDIKNNKIFINQGKGSKDRYVLTTNNKKKLLEICKRNNIVFLGIFGSVAKGGYTEDSDIDLLVRFSKPKSLLGLVRLERIFSEVLGRKTDLLTEAAISPYLRDRIKKKRWRYFMEDRDETGKGV